MKYCTGIGSRAAKDMPDVYSYIWECGWEIIERTLYVLRSGGADGADLAFETGYGEGEKEIYLPWKGFNKENRKPSPYDIWDIPKEAEYIASQIRPAWAVCDQAVKKLHSRNVCQILGKDLKTPSSKVVCWTKDGKKSGGTRTALVLAEEYNIPIYNIYNEYMDIEHFKGFLLGE